MLSSSGVELQITIYLYRKGCFFSMVSFYRLLSISLVKEIPIYKNQEFARFSVSFCIISGYVDSN